jgi:oxygen-independent coproporphyrinogen III oxidase
VSRRWQGAAPSDTLRFEPERVFAAGLRNHHVSNTAYPIAHDTTWRPYRVPHPDVESVTRAAWDGIGDLCLYVHIPFCETRCSFCEYTVVRREEIPWVRQYMDDLIQEFDLQRAALGTRNRLLHGFDIGGGTPSFVPAEEIARVVATARESFRFAPGSDISIETTPRIAAAEPEKVAAYKRAGIDRISMGVQVIQPDLLKILNREANGVAAHRRAVDNIRAAGFTRLNVDLMYGFAGQSLESWRATLQHAVGLGPEYITLYRMRYKLTRISHQARAVSLDAVRPLAALAKALLSDAGYHANPGKTTFSRIPGDVGTSSYLARRVREGMPYLGLGLGAQSFSHTTISYNDGAVGKNLLPYHRSIERGRLPLQDLYDLPRRQVMGKMCAVSFYFGEIRRAPFAAKFGVTLEDAFPDEVDFVRRRGLMEWTDEALRLTPEGTRHVNGVIALFFAPSIQKHLIDRDPERAEDMERNRRLAVRVAGSAAHA